ncbi:DUF1513 domain-containing protein [Pseudoroseicyclus tamaricis]|uniref:DUF1513 domain-containing protein n=1 Tax=Pseudoroseicyclus tamaricis TaxID=2705421 RepID=A0A6B2JSP1_9RHOB|nr:DUF1513 domain-containing protein [Pseudoroseicyclus tamaricis]NDV01020.1 DUF1513 domain-containing protein [Pseudoroseicyclus tamaricis]
MPSRRLFLATLAASASGASLGWAAAGAPRFLAAARLEDGTFDLVGLRGTGEAVFRVPLPARGHAGAGHPVRPEAVVFGRRPGTFALVVDCALGAVMHELAPPEGSVFNGHGSYLDGGRLLITAEQRTADSEGRLGIWDAAHGYARLGEVPTHGLGPHEARVMPDGVTIAVANGGVSTEDGREMLNIATMEPNLAYLTLTGGLEEIVELPELRQNSIRHLAFAAGGVTAFAMQWVGAEDEAPPLLGLHRRGEAPVLCAAPGAEQLGLHNYTGTVSTSGDGREVGITSTPGGVLHRFALDGSFLGAVARGRLMGLAPLPGGFLTTDEQGGLMAVEGGVARPLAKHPEFWDNHLITL